MNRKSFRLVLLAAVATMAVAATIPAGAVSGYHMNGQGSLTLSGGGLPACAGVAGNCTARDISFSWGELTVQGAGLLQDQQVAGTYSCKSEGTVGNTPFQSRILGTTSSFELTFNFQCARDAGSTGPAFINGWFSNYDGGSSNLAFHTTATHPYPVPTQPGLFFFKGFFSASNTHPYQINDANGDAMACTGGFAPTGTDGDTADTTTITSAAFLGACTAVSA